MHESNKDSLNALDNIRLTRGSGSLTMFFYKLLRNNAPNAIDLVNDENLSFTSLFILHPLIKKLNLTRGLSTRNQNVLELIPAILERKSSVFESLSATSRQSLHSTLKWILETGCRQDGLNDQYERILDTVSILLLKQYKDRTVIPSVISTLFDRYRKDGFTYDLIWAYLEAHDPYSLTLFADGLNSTHPKDIELSQKLLSFIPCIRMNAWGDHKKQALCAQRWLKENMQFLYYTGESFQQTCNPILYAISYEAKYLCKPVSPETGKISVPLTEADTRLLDRFRVLDPYSRMLLSNYSSSLCQRNTPFWNNWLRSPIGEQLYSAKMQKGGI